MSELVLDSGSGGVSDSGGRFHSLGLSGKQRPINAEALAELEAMAERWNRSARRAFYDATFQPKGSTGRDFIEHGAVCYHNCHSELVDFIISQKLALSANQVTDQA